MLPTLAAYQEATEHPASAFLDPDLRRARPDLDGLGLPRPRSGNMAVVFRLEGPSGSWAVRCFRRLQPGQGERYAAIARHLRARRLPCFVPFAYQERGILVEGAWQPIVKMAWAEGERLDRYLGRVRHDPGRMADFLGAWLRLLRDLDQGRIAHGDLQHGNVLVSEGRLSLVDYDGMFVPGLAGLPANELGHPNYQHPLRAEGDFAPWLDRFAGRAVFLAAAALACAPELWERFGAGDEALLFHARDFPDPQAPIWQALRDLGRPGIARLADDLLAAAAGPVAAVPRLPAAMDVQALLARPAVRAPVRRAAPAAPAPPSAAGSPPAPLPVEAGAAATWLLGDDAGLAQREVSPSPLDRLLAGSWAVSTGAAAALRHAVPALDLLAWAGIGGGLLGLRYSRQDAVRERALWRRAVTDARRRAAMAQADRDAAAAALAAARARAAAAGGQIARRRDELARRRQAAAAELRRGAERDLFAQRRRELVADALGARQARLERLRQDALRERLERRLVLADPALDIRRGVKQALAAAGVRSAWDIATVRDSSVGRRDGTHAYLPALLPERAARLKAWHAAALRQAEADLPARLPAEEERRLAADLQARLRSLRRERHRALRAALAAARPLLRDLGREALAAEREDALLQASGAQEEGRWLEAFARAQADLRRARWREAALARRTPAYAQVRFLRFLRALLPGATGSASSAALRRPSQGSAHRP